MFDSVDKNTVLYGNSQIHSKVVLLELSYLKLNALNAIANNLFVQPPIRTKCFIKKKKKSYSLKIYLLLLALAIGNI